MSNLLDVSLIFFRLILINRQCTIFYTGNQSLLVICVTFKVINVRAKHF